MLQPIYDFLSSVLPGWSEFFYNAFMVPIGDYVTDGVIGDLWQQVMDIWDIADQPIIYVLVSNIIYFYVVWSVIKFLIPFLK